MLKGLVNLAKCVKDLRKSEETDEEILLRPFSPVELRSRKDFIKLEEIFGDIDRLNSLLKAKDSIGIFIERNKDDSVIINNDERDSFSYNAIRKAIEDSIANLKKEAIKLGYSYSENGE